MMRHAREQRTVCDDQPLVPLPPLTTRWVGVDLAPNASETYVARRIELYAAETPHHLLVRALQRASTFCTDDVLDSLYKNAFDANKTTTAQTQQDVSGGVTRELSLADAVKELETKKKGTNAIPCLAEFRRALKGESPGHVRRLPVRQAEPARAQVPALVLHAVRPRVGQLDEVRRLQRTKPAARVLQAFDAEGTSQPGRADSHGRRRRRARFCGPDARPHAFDAYRRRPGRLAGHRHDALRATPRTRSTRRCRACRARYASTTLGPKNRAGAAPPSCLPWRARSVA